MQEKFQYGYSFQTKLIACLFKDRAFLQQIMDILDPVYFESAHGLQLNESYQALLSIF